MKIIIDSYLSPNITGEILVEYFRLFGNTKWEKGMLGIEHEKFDFIPTGKYPEKIQLGSWDYWVACKKNKASYTFLIRNAS